MKIKKLQFTTSSLFVGEQAKADSTTHDIEKTADGYLCHHRRSGDVYFVPFAHAIAQLDMSDPPETEEDTADADEPAARRPAGRRGRQKASPPPVQT